MKIENNFIMWYALLLAIHFIHIVEEILGNAKFITSFYGGVWNFFIINLVLWFIPLVFLYFLKKKVIYAYYFFLIYGTIMIVDGVSHIVEFLVTGIYFNGVAGVLTGIILIPLGAKVALDTWRIIHKKRG